MLEPRGLGTTGSTFSALAEQDLREMFGINVDLDLNNTLDDDSDVPKDYHFGVPKTPKLRGRTDRIPSQEFLANIYRRYASIRVDCLTEVYDLLRDPDICIDQLKYYIMKYVNELASRCSENPEQPAIQLGKRRGLRKNPLRDGH